MLSQFVTDHYASVCIIPSQAVSDQRMIDMMQPDGPYDNEAVYTWLQDYGLFQGVTNEERWDAVDIIRDTRPNLAPNQTRANVHLLMTALYQAKSRSWLSATSKILWCRFPADIVIYDAFVERVLTVLQWIEPALTGEPRLGRRPKMTHARDTGGVADYYQTYENQVRRLLARYQDQFDGLRHETGVNYPYDIRILDKMLWRMGSVDRQRDWAMPEAAE